MNPVGKRASADIIPNVCEWLTCQACRGERRCTAIPPEAETGHPGGRKASGFHSAGCPVSASGGIAVQRRGEPMPRPICSLVCLLLTSALLPAADFETEKQQNWHHWRGSDANGFAAKADPPTKWDANTNLRWKAELPGPGSSTPIVWGERIFVLAAVRTDREAKPEELPKPDPRFKTNTQPPKNFYKFIVLCFDRNSGKKLWEKLAAEQVPHEGHHTSHSYC